jgi:hypothetical protein
MELKIADLEFTAFWSTIGDDVKYVSLTVEGLGGLAQDNSTLLTADEMRRLAEFLLKAARKLG